MKQTKSTKPKVKTLKWLIPALLVVLSFTGRHKTPAGWTRTKAFGHAKDSFLLAPASYYFPWWVKRDSAGHFHSMFAEELSATDTIPISRNAYLAMIRTGDYPSNDLYQHIDIQKAAKDTLALTIWQGDGEWFCKYVIKVCGKYHKATCEPGYPDAASDYARYGITFNVSDSILELDKRKYNVGDSIKGYLDGSFAISEPDKWKARIRLVGPFKGVVQCDTCK